MNTENTENRKNVSRHSEFEIDLNYDLSAHFMCSMQFQGQKQASFGAPYQNMTTLKTPTYASSPSMADTGYNPKPIPPVHDNMVKEHATGLEDTDASALDHQGNTHEYYEQTGRLPFAVTQTTSGYFPCHTDRLGMNIFDTGVTVHMTNQYSSTTMDNTGSPMHSSEPATVGVYNLNGHTIYYPRDENENAGYTSSSVYHTSSLEIEDDEAFHAEDVNRRPKSTQSLPENKSVRKKEWKWSLEANFIPGQATATSAHSSQPHSSHYSHTSSQNVRHVSSQQYTHAQAPIYYYHYNDQPTYKHTSDSLVLPVQQSSASYPQFTTQHNLADNDSLAMDQFNPPYSSSDDHIRSKQRPQFNKFLSPAEVRQKLAAGILVSGTLRINKRNRLDTYVTSEALDSDIYICGNRDRNRALDGDIVAVRLVDVERVWKAKKRNTQFKIEQRKQRTGDYEDYDELSNLDKIKPKYCGEVVAIINRSEGQHYAGTLSIDRPLCDIKTTDARRKNLNHVWFWPLDTRTPFIMVPVRNVPNGFLEDESKYKNRLFLAVITSWSIASSFPFGEIVKDLGVIGDMRTETAAMLADCRIYDAPFDPLVNQYLPPSSWSIPQSEIDKRLDLRDARIFSIDPATAQDLDDAVHIEVMEDGNYEVGVHIADVSYFVRVFTPLDTEARKRGSTTYLPDRSIPLLPPVLSEKICSLKPNADKLAFSIIWKMDHQGNVHSTWFGKSVIRSCTKLAYEDAQNVIEGRGLPAKTMVFNHMKKDVEDDIMRLYHLSQHLRKRRFDQGALSLNSVKLTFSLDNNGEPIDVRPQELKEANRLIEELMLLANMSVAEKIYKHFPDEALLRRHAPPIESRLQNFLATTKDLGLSIDASSAGSLHASLSAFPGDHKKAVLQTLATKPMQRAKYFSSGALDVTKHKHYALNIPLYTHFTSPIRRYADVIVHRQLQALLESSQSSGYTKQLVQKIALDCNRKHDAAKNAQELSSQIYLSRYIYRRSLTDGPFIRSAVVMKVTKNAFEVLVPEYGLEKRIYVKSLPIVRYESDDNELRIFWKKDAMLYLCSNRDVESDSDDLTLDSEGASSSDETISTTQGTIIHADTKDSDVYVQHIKVFAELDVLIEANIDVSPPDLRVHPLSPFQPRSKL